MEKGLEIERLEYNSDTHRIVIEYYYEDKDLDCSVIGIDFDKFKEFLPSDCVAEYATFDGTDVDQHYTPLSNEMIINNLEAFKEDIILYLKKHE